ncbi:MAG TPA: dTDP-glucose 4,6-dehydratase [Thermoguttaceae bacterium]|nr:dTDP-glucose 4,6-dehydratase [Thermoguttaceae bacterium]
MPTILVTGGAGFIGSCFVRQELARPDCRVVNLDKLTYAGNLDSLADVLGDPRHAFVEGDIADADLVGRLLAEHEPWAMVNFAAESHVDRSIDSPEPFVATNVVGTFHLLEATRRYWRGLSTERRAAFRLLHISTDEVFGAVGPDGAAFTETTRYAPNSPYSASKAAADHFARAYFQTYGLPVLVTNCSNNFGPYQFPEKLMPLMILSALEGRPLPVYGDGLQIRDWLFVEDHTRALRRVLDAGTRGEVYNIGADCRRTNLDVVRAICRLVDRLRPELPHRPCESLIRFVKDRPGHDRHYAIDASKLRRELGWTPREQFESGLEKTVRWYLDHPDWVRRVTDGTYRRLGLKNT